MKNFLIIEDESRTAQSLKKGLLEHHYEAELATDGEMGLALLNQNEYELIILDVMLPKMDGWQILRQIRAQGRQTPVLMLTALNDINDRVRGLQAGADDYLAKPFAFSEFLARVEAILRRTRPNVPRKSLSVGDLSINLIHQTVRRGSQQIELSPKEFQLLCMLVENAGRFVSRKELVARVWNIHFDCETNVVDVAIRRLRQKVDEGFATKLIKTVRGVGYVLDQTPSA
jgi:two-component system copper resistance phosphate regulon response regulator CusR